MDQLGALIDPICKKACCSYSIRHHDREEIAQEVYLRLHGRHVRKGMPDLSANWVRKSARLEANKLCKRVHDRELRERPLNFEPPW